VDQPGDEALEELALAKHDHGLVPGALGEIVEALRRPAEPDEVDQQPDPAPEQVAADGERRRERDRSEQQVYGPRAFLSSLVIAGTIWVRSPITA
jgi:hypothetical protein